jgi:hypothetical protein
MGVGRPLVILGGILALVGLVLVLRARKHYRRYKRVRSTLNSPIAKAKGGGFVSVAGRIVPSDQGVARAPFSGKAAVWIRVVVEELRSPTRRAYWHPLFDDVEARNFLVDDGSGQAARVIPRNAEALLLPRNTSSSGFYYDDPVHLEAFLQSRGSKSTKMLGFSGSMRYREEILVAGEVVQVLGLSRREAAGPGAHGRRLGPAHQLVLFQGPGDELLITNRTPEQLVHHTLAGLVAGIVFLILGGVVAATGALALYYPHHLHH